jgi:hypothetical protein
MNSRLVALTARRSALQAECALQRDDIARTYGEIAGGAARVDRAINTVRRLTPLLVVIGAGVLLALGPGRALALLSRGLTLGLFAQKARRLLAR